jgi:hypothetical protein
LNVDSKVQHFAFEVNDQHIWAMHKDLEIIMLTFVNENVFVVVRTYAKVNPWNYYFCTIFIYLLFF